jgi:hypothetical protein
MNKKCLFLFPFFFLMACSATSTRNDVEKFDLKMVGNIRPTDVIKFSDCILNELSPLEGTELKRRKIKQTKWSWGTRVDTRVGDNTILLASIDINDNGKVEIFETNAFPLFDAEPEIEAFKICINQFSK